MLDTYNIYKLFILSFLVFNYIISTFISINHNNM